MRSAPVMGFLNVLKPYDFSFMPIMQLLSKIPRAPSKSGALKKDDRIKIMYTENSLQYNTIDKALTSSAMN